MAGEPRGLPVSGDDHTGHGVTCPMCGASVPIVDGTASHTCPKPAPVSGDDRTRDALERLKAKVLDRRQMVTEGPMIGRIKVAGWIESELRAVSGADHTGRGELDLDAIEQRLVVESTWWDNYGNVGLAGRAHAARATETTLALVAEVRRLRAQRDAVVRAWVVPGHRPDERNQP